MTPGVSSDTTLREEPRETRPACRAPLWPGFFLICPTSLVLLPFAKVSKFSLRRFFNEVLGNVVGRFCQVQDMSPLEVLNFVLVEILDASSAWSPPLCRPNRQRTRHLCSHFAVILEQLLVWPSTASRRCSVHASSISFSASAMSCSI